MKSLKRDFVPLFAITALTLICALAWGSPFLTTQPTGRQGHAQQQSSQNQSKTGTFTGKIVRNGDTYVLHDSSGATFGLDDPERAKAFEGKVVKVTGQLDEQSRVIHVDNIESA